MSGKGGAIQFAVSSLCFIFISTDTGFWMLVAWFGLNRIGMGMLIPATSVAAIQSVSPALLPYATTTMTFFLGLGGAISINAFSILCQWQLDRKPHAPSMSEVALTAFQTCFWLAVALLLVALLAARWIRRNGNSRSGRPPDTRHSAEPS